MTRIVKTVVPVALALAVACGDSNRAPAEAAINGAIAAVAKLGADASAYAPEGVAAIQKSLATAKELAGNKEYEGALKAASGIPAKVDEVLAAAAAKKAELARAWDESAAKVTATVASIQGRLAALKQAKKLPAGLTRAAVDQASADVAALESGLARLAEDAKGGKISQAIAGARDLQAKGEAILASLGKS